MCCVCYCNSFNQIWSLNNHLCLIYSLLCAYVNLLHVKAAEWWSTDHCKNFLHIFLCQKKLVLAITCASVSIWPFPPKIHAMFIQLISVLKLEACICVRVPPKYNYGVAIVICWFIFLLLFCFPLINICCVFSFPSY